MAPLFIILKDIDMINKRMKKDEIIREYKELETDYEKLAACYDYALDMLTWFIAEFAEKADREQAIYIHHRAKVMKSLIMKRISNDEIDGQGSSNSVCVNVTREEV